METKAYMSSVEYYNQTLEKESNGSYQTDSMEFVVLASSFAEAEEMIKKACGEDLITIYGIDLMEATPLFK